MIEEYKNTFNDEGVAEVKASIVSSYDSEREVTEEEFAHFIGRNAKYYIERFKKFKINGVDKFSVTWLWPPFFFSCFWMAYRKMYIWAIGALVLETIFYSVHYLFTILFKVLFAIAGNYLYYKHTKRKILRLKTTRTFSDSSEMLTALERKGGVNYWLALISIAFYILGIISLLENLE